MKGNKALILGTFDLTHYGHYRKFKMLKELGYNTVAGVTTDAFATEYKRKPILNLNERIENLESCRYVDEVIVNIGGHNSKDDILFSEVDTVVRGGDWFLVDWMNQVGVTAEWLEANKITLITLPYSKGISTTEIRRRVKDAKE